MKTTIDIPDDLYPTLAAASSAAGVSLEGFVLSAAREKAGGSVRETAGAKGPPHDGATIGDIMAEHYARLDRTSPRERADYSQAVAEVQAVIDEEFSKVDPRDWE